MCKVPVGKVITYGDVSVLLCGNKSKSIPIGSALNIGGIIQNIQMNGDFIEQWQIMICMKKDMK